MILKNKINWKSFSVFFCLLVLPVFVYWFWFLKFDVLTAGDWGFYFKDTQLTFLSFPYTWVLTSFGGVSVSMSSFFSFFATGTLSFLNNFPLSERLIYMWPAVLLSPICSYVLLKKILSDRLPAVIGSFVFCYSTYMVMEKEGHITLMVAFALAPLIIYFFMRTLEEKRLKLAVITGLVSFVSAAYDFRVFYIIAFVLFLYFLHYAFFINEASPKNLLKNSWYALVPIIIVFTTNLFWILGLYQTGSITSNSLFNRGLFGNDFMGILNSINLFHPFWSGANPTIFFVQPVPPYFFLIPIFAFLGLFLNRKNKNVLFFAVISLLGIFLAKQVGAPFPGAYQWLFDHFPGFNAFRESSKFFFLVTLGYSVLVGSFVAWLWKNMSGPRWKEVTKYSLTFLIAVLFLWNIKPVITGEINGLFDARHVPSDYIILKDFILNQPGYFRTMWTPIAPRWAIYTDMKPDVSNIAAVQTDWVDLLASYNKTGVSTQDLMLHIFDLPFANNLFDDSSIKYVVVPIQDTANDDDFYVNYGKASDPNIRQEYIDKLDNVGFLKRVDIGAKDLVVYENEGYKEHIFTTKESESIYKNIPTQNVDFEYINPTEYRVHLKNVKDETFLNFAEAYHPDWKVRIGYFNWFNVLTDKNYFMEESQHTKSDAGLNSFLIDLNYIKHNYPSGSYKTNQDGSVDVVLTIFFKPQSYTDIGFIISLVVLFGCVVYLGWGLARVWLVKYKNEKS